MLKWIEKTTNGRIVVVLFLLAMGLYLVMMVVTIPEIRAGAGGVEIFDMRPLGYSEQEALFILDNLPETTRAYYRTVQIPIDFFYPLMLGLFGAFAVAWSRRWVSRE